MVGKLLSILPVIVVICMHDVDALRPGGSHVCSRVVYSTESYRVLVGYYVQTSYSTCCAQFIWCWKKCTKYRRTRHQRYEVRTRQRRSTVYYCCSGYRERNNECPIPICNQGCLLGTCVAPDNCRCKTGYKGYSCNININECRTNNGGCQQSCTDTNGSFQCSCILGYRLSYNRRNCVDLNECQLSSTLCICGDRLNNPNCTTSCINTIGSYRCQCSSGYNLKSNKRICLDINECSTNNGDCQQICENKPGSYECGCNRGFLLENINNSSCINKNECSSSNGDCEHICTDTYGSYNCTCRTGYHLDSNGKTCSDHNECATTSHGCQDKCVNRKGHYICECKNGYQLNNDQKTCSDVNECTLGTHECAQTCINTIGSYQCKCRPGFILNSDNKTCADVNECLMGSNACNQICYNTIGSYHCFCKIGYKLSENNRTCTGLPCQNMPPLYNGNATCLIGMTDDRCTFECHKGFNLQGSSERVCEANHRWNGSTARCERKECDEFEPPLYGSVSLPCLNIFKSSCQVHCMEGYYVIGNANAGNTRTCQVSNENKMFWTNTDMVCNKSQACVPNPCDHNGVCQVLGHGNEKYLCNCEDTGYIGETCEIGIIVFPQVPIMSINRVMYGIELIAKPDTDLTVSISTNSRSFLVEPTELKFNQSTTSVTLTFIATEPGFFKLSFRLSGTNEPNFRTPFESVIFVDGNYSTETIVSPINPDGTLKLGCYQNKISINENNVQEADDNEITITSSMAWEDDSSNGIIQVTGKFGTDIPVSLYGANLNNGRDLVDVVTINKQTPQKGTELEGTTCYSSYNPKKYTSYLLKTNAFLFAIQTIFNKNSPFWFKVYAQLFEKEYESSDLGGDLFKGSQLITSKTPCTKGLKFISSQIYYLYSTRRTYHVLFPHKNITLPSTYLKCFIKNMETSEITFAFVLETGKNRKEPVSKDLSKLLRFNGSVDHIGFNLNQRKNNNKNDYIYSYETK